MSAPVKFPQGPFTDPTTGELSHEWFMWLQSLNNNVAYVMQSMLTQVNSQSAMINIGEEAGDSEQFLVQIPGPTGPKGERGLFVPGMDGQDGDDSLGLPLPGTGLFDPYGAAAAVTTSPASYSPVLTFGGGSTGITYTTQTGRWGKIGPRVFFDLRITLSNKGASTGIAVISLPVAISGSTILSAFSVGFVSALAAGTTTQIISYGSAGTSNCNVLKRDGAGGSTGLLDTDFTNTSQLVISGNYEF